MQTIGALVLVGFSCIHLFASSVNTTVPIGDGLLAGARIVLHIEGLKLPPHSSGILRVFADLPDANANTNTENEHYLGYVAVAPKNSIEANRGIQRPSVTLDLTDKRQVFAGKKQIVLTLVSLGEQKEQSTSQKPTFTALYLAQ